MYIRCATNTAIFRSRSIIRSDAPTIEAAARFMSDMLASKLTASSITPGFNTPIYSIYSRCTTDPHSKSLCLHLSNSAC
jgi:hypothetical protein